VSFASFKHFQSSKTDHLMGKIAAPVVMGQVAAPVDMHVMGKIAVAPQPKN
jgi:hypothetical protein